MDWRKNKSNHSGRWPGALLALLILAALWSVSPAAAATEGLDLAPNVPLPTEETPLWQSYPWGNYAADAARQAGNTDLALVDNAAALGCLEEQTTSLATAQLNENQLRQILEACLEAVTVDAETETISSRQQELGAFPQISGFSFRYDPTAPTGERITSIETEGSWPLSVTAPAHLLTSLEGDAVTPLTSGLLEAVRQYTQPPGADNLNDQRIQVIGTADHSLTSVFPRWMLIAFPLLAAVLVGLSTHRNNRWKDTKGVFLNKR